MKLQIVSDMHLELENNHSFYNHCKPLAPVLIVAGDLCYWDCSIDDKYRREEEKFFKWTEGKWNKVIRVLGNHDFWHNTIHEDLCISDGHMLTVNNRSFEYNGINFICSTLWGEIPEPTRIRLSYCMDFQKIYNFTPAKFTESGILAKNFIKKAVAESDKKSVIISHHLPSWLLVDDEFKSHGDGNYIFATSLDDFIIDNSDKIQCWIHGHSHTFRDEIIHGVRMIRNPYGYYHERCSNSLAPERKFQKDFVIEVN